MNNRYKNFVFPRVFFLGYTKIDMDGLVAYLTYTDQKEFLEDIEEAKKQGISDGEILCSFYAKMCYSSLTTKKNKNISKVRGISDNIVSILDSGHGSVCEQATMNFVVTDCSRLYTHEQVRHRVGVAYSQTSGRYVRSDVLNVVIDPILEPAYDLVEECRVYLQDWYKKMEQRLKIDELEDFTSKKKLTSALRRMLPNAQANEIGISLNFRSARHIIEMRTSEHAEWEIRLIYNQVYDIVKSKFPIMFIDSKEEIVDGQRKITFKNKKI